MAGRRAKVVLVEKDLQAKGVVGFEVQARRIASDGVKAQETEAADQKSEVLHGEGSGEWT